MKLRLLALVLPVGLLAALGGSAADARTNADTLLSQGKPVIASSLEDDTLTAGKAVDGSTSTRWASAEGADPQWIRVDLGQAATVGRVKLNWEAAYAKAYRIEVSDDGTAFSTVKTVADGNGATDDLTGLQGHGRYVRVVGAARHVVRLLAVGARGLRHDRLDRRHPGADGPGRSEEHRRHGHLGRPQLDRLDRQHRRQRVRRTA